MAFVNSVQQICPGFGAPTQIAQKTNVACNVGNTVTLLQPTSSGSFQGGQAGITKGYVRAKSLTLGVNSQVRIINVVGYSATVTNGIVLYAGDPALEANNLGVDETIDFCTDAVLTNINVAINVNTSNTAWDIEVAGTL